MDRAPVVPVENANPKGLARSGFSMSSLNEGNYTVNPEANGKHTVIIEYGCLRALLF